MRFIEVRANEFINALSPKGGCREQKKSLSSLLPTTFFGLFIFMIKIDINKIIGCSFGRLTAIKESNPYLTKQGFKRKTVECLCICGKIKIVKYDCLKLGNTKSCGCYKKDNPPRTTHGKRGSDEYSIWCGIKNRCYNNNEKKYLDWGGRGIKVCDRWLNSFEIFLEDMGERPSNKHSIDRIDNNGDYCKENCRWATLKEQANNKRNNVYYEYNGELKTLPQWAEIFSIKPHLLWQRINRDKMMFEKAIIKINKI